MLPTCVLDYTNSYHFTYTFYLLFYFFDLGAMTDCDLFLKTNSLNMINKSLKKNYINFSNIFYSSRHSPPPPHTSFFSIPSTNIFSLTCFRLSRKSWTGVINIPVSRNNHCIRENGESSVLRTVTKWLRGLRFPLHT